MLIFIRQVKTIYPLQRAMIDIFDILTHHQVNNKNNNSYKMDIGRNTPTLWYNREKYLGEF